MKPLKLQMKNFGPYVNESVDFTKFEQASVFLISGKTGTGKTTIFDAIVFALFDKTSGEDREVKQMRSDFANSDEITEVNFTFEHDGIEYTVKRTPQMILKKKRGNGLKSESAKASVKYIDSHGKKIEIVKKTQVDDFLRDLIGLDAQQFTQIILLPQGKFRNFLNSNSADREKILRKLFGTGIYKKWTERIKNQAKEKEDENKKIQIQIQTQIQNFQQQIEIKFEDKLNEDKWLEKIAVQVRLLKEEQEELKRRSNRQREIVDEFTEKYQQQKILAINIKKLEELRQTFRKINQKQVEIDLKKEHLDQLMWYQKHQAIFLAKDNLEHKLNYQTKKRKLLEEKQEKKQQELVEVERRLVELEKENNEYEKLQIKIATLSEKIPLYQELDKTKQIYDEYKQELEKLRVALQKKEEYREQNQKEMNEISKKILELNDLEKREIKLAEMKTKLTQLQDNIIKIDDRENNITQKKVEYENLKEKLQFSQEKAEESEEYASRINALWIKNQIYFLAKQLEPNEKCPVCGSKEHPQPAEIQNLEKIDEMEMKKAHKQAEKNRNDVNELKIKLNNLNLEITEISKKNQENLQTIASELKLKDVDNLEKIKIHMQGLNDEYEQKCEKLEHLKNQRKELQLRYEKLQQEAKKLVEDYGTITNKYNECYREYTVKKTSIKEQIKRLGKDFVDVNESKKQLVIMKEDLQSYKENLSRIKSNYQTLKTNVIEIKTDMRNYQQIIKQLKEELKQNKTNVEEILKDKPEISKNHLLELAHDLINLDNLNEEIKKFDNEKLVLKTQISELSKKTDNQTTPDLKKSLQQLEQKQQMFQKLQDEIGAIRVKIQHMIDIQREMKKLLAERKDNDTLIAEWNQLVEVISGKSATKLSLERYVLQMYLQKVLNVANYRLHELTQGRYIFQLKNEKGSWASDTGLEINVYDDNAGKVRSVKTLSGGESFIAALALALALGEVIQAHVGGIFVDTLFVDEGFGSLDSDALQIAMEALQTIEGKNRMVGIISHVKELQTQIPYQINITGSYGKSKISYQIQK